MDFLDLDDFANLVESYSRRWASAGVEWELHRGPADRAKQAAWVECETNQRVAGLIVWTTGEAELDLADISGDATATHYDVTDASELRPVLDRISDHLSSGR